MGTFCRCPSWITKKYIYKVTFFGPNKRQTKKMYMKERELNADLFRYVRRTKLVRDFEKKIRRKQVFYFVVIYIFKRINHWPPSKFQKFPLIELQNPQQKRFVIKNAGILYTSLLLHLLERALLLREHEKSSPTFCWVVKYPSNSSWPLGSFPSLGRITLEKTLHLFFSEEEHYRKEAWAVPDRP